MQLLTLSRGAALMKTFFPSLNYDTTNGKSSCKMTIECTIENGDWAFHTYTYLFWIDFWITMNSSRMQDLVQKARDLALDGDYTSSLVYYEEWKEQFEKTNGFSPLPSQKRVWFVLYSHLVIWYSFVRTNRIEGIDRRDQES